MRGLPQGFSVNYTWFIMLASITLPFVLSGDEFDVHTKCFTEDERYGAKGQVNGVVKKGEVKQESWVEMIRSIIKEEPNMKPPHRNLLNKISAFNNVPRKKPKFLVVY